MSTKKTSAPKASKTSANVGNQQRASRTPARETPPPVGPSGYVIPPGPKAPDDPRVLALALQAYELFVNDRYTIKEIAKTLLVHRDVVSRLLKQEGERRRTEEAAARQGERDRSVSTCRRVERYYLARMASAEAKGDEGSRAVEAAEKAAKLLGCYEPEKIIVENVPVSRFAGVEHGQLFALLNKIPDAGPFAQHG